MELHTHSPENICMSPLAGEGAYCVGSITGRTACFLKLEIGVRGPSRLTS